MQHYRSNLSGNDGVFKFRFRRKYNSRRSKCNKSIKYEQSEFNPLGVKYKLPQFVFFKYRLETKFHKTLAFLKYLL